MTASPVAGGEGIVCLANDGIIDGLRALCESLRVNSPGIPLTVIPFNEDLTRTRELLARSGHQLYEDASLQAMDALGRGYWPGEQWRPHAMRKLCAFWGPYERFLFLDADIVVLSSLRPYFDWFAGDSAQLMYFEADLNMVYSGAVREEMVSRRGAVGFQTGVFMGRRGAVSPEALDSLMEGCAPYRHGFVDILEQTFLNYVTDTLSLSKVNAHEAVPEVSDGWAGMRLKRRGEGFVLADARMPRPGRPVTLIHWGGYPIGPFMPFRSTFLKYRLAGASRAERLRYRAAALISTMRGLSYRTPLHLVYRWRYLINNWLEARGRSFRHR